jgi:hypothetical protein
LQLNSRKLADMLYSIKDFKHNKSLSDKEIIVIDNLITQASQLYSIA